MPYKNPEDQRAASKAHYQRNKGSYKLRAKTRNKKQRKWSKEFVSRVKNLFSCIDCGESNPLVLDFDHVKGEKVNNISDMVGQSYSIESIKNEMRKCEVRCANCHRIKTHERHNA